MPENLEITCVTRTNRPHLHERIQAVGGVSPSGNRWALTQREAIASIESGKRTFYVGVAGKAVWVIIGVTRSGEKYLKTLADNESPASLLLLANCP